jgi:hypothetical protein
MTQISNKYISENSKTTPSKFPTSDLLNNNEIFSV